MDTMILSINPGSTSTKVAAYKNEDEVFCETLCHSNEDLSKFSGIWQQKEYRTKLVLDCLAKHNIMINSLSAVVGRGGLLPPVKSGAYEVNQAMIACMESGGVFEHASNLGCAIADDIAKTIGIKAYIYDSVAVDELEDVARYTGIPEITRSCLSHALNSRAIAYRLGQDVGIPYKEGTFIVAHLGGSISLSLHYKGRMIEFVDNDEGPFGPESCGKISAKSFTSFVEKTDIKDVRKRVRGAGGVMAHLGTADMREAEAMVMAGDEKAKAVLMAMAYQIAKSIGELSTVVSGKVDYIALTGGVAHTKMITEDVIKRVSFIAPVNVYPGEDEMKSLSLGARRVLLGEEEARIYT